ncbi:MAG: zeta toxin family protein [Burkholderiaceae bacterium]
MTRAKRPPSLERLLADALQGERKPAAFVLAGHNGSGKSTLWYERLAPKLHLPLINADRLTASILPHPDPETKQLPTWAQRLRDDDQRWQSLSQEAVQTFVSLVMERRMAFAFETVFSHWKPLPDGTHESKIDLIRDLQRAGYFVVLVFVGLASVDLSILRVDTRKQQGGHGVPMAKLRQRFPRTQLAVGNAASIADMTVMLDNSRRPEDAFALVRAQRGSRLLFDCRDNAAHRLSPELVSVATLWLNKVCGPL